MNHIDPSVASATVEALDRIGSHGEVAVAILGTPDDRRVVVVTTDNLTPRPGTLPTYRVRRVRVPVDPSDPVDIGSVHTHGTGADCLAVAVTLTV